MIFNRPSSKIGYFYREIGQEVISFLPSTLATLVYIVRLYRFREQALKKVQ